MRAIVSAISTMPSKSTGRSPGKPHQEVKLDAFVVVLKRRATTFKQVVVLDLLANLFAHIIESTSGANVRPARRSLPINSAIDRNCSLTRKLGIEIFTPAD